MHDAPSVCLSRPVKPPVVVVGLGQLGTAFAEGFLRLGYPIIPVLRNDALLERFEESLRLSQDAPLTVVAVPEDDLNEVLHNVPDAARDRVVLLQNELRSSVWQDAPIEHPTVAVVWFEKKPHKPVTEVLATKVAGPRRELVARALSAFGVTAEVLEPHTEEELAHQLALKNLYILSLNLLGLRTGGTAGELLERHEADFSRLVDELIRLEAMLTNEPLDAGRLRRALGVAIQADPDHGCAGRSARRRLARTLEQARAVGVALPFVDELAREHCT